MARTCTVVFLLLTSVLCAANCSLDKEKLNRIIRNDKEKLEQLLQVVKDVLLKQVNATHLTVHILVIGGVGVGKSTLVNALVGMDVAKTGNDVQVVTKKTNQIVAIKNGVFLNITDTPGLGDLHMKDDDTLHDIQKTCKDVDVFLFCLKMTQRFDRRHIEEMKSITKVLGKDIWRKGLLVLTFANEINEKEDFTYILQEWESDIRQKLKILVFDSDISEKIPIVPAGFKEPQLPDRANWIRELWIQGFRRMGLRGHVEKGGSQDVDENPEDHSWITHHMSKEMTDIDPNLFPLFGKLIGGTIGALISLIPGVGHCYLPVTAIAGAYLGNWTGALLRDSFDWKFKEAEVAYDDQALLYALITAFLEEYPEYEKLLS